MRFALHRGLITTNNLAEIQREFDKLRVKGMNTIAPDELADFLANFYQAKDDGRFSLLSFYTVMLEDKIDLFTLEERCSWGNSTSTGFWRTETTNFSHF